MATISTLSLKSILKKKKEFKVYSIDHIDGLVSFKASLLKFISFVLPISFKLMVELAIASSSYA
jgi:hypothetical protein